MSYIKNTYSDFNDTKKNRIMENYVANIYNLFLLAEKDKNNIKNYYNSVVDQLQRELYNKTMELEQKNNELSTMEHKENIDISKFPEKCNSYYKNKLNDELLDSKYKSSIDALKLRLTKNIDKQERDYLKQRIIALSNECKIKKTINDMIINYDCNQLSQLLKTNDMSGGSKNNTSNIEYKISKYSKKFNDNFENDTYYNKLNQYIEELSGGSYNNIVTPTIDNILKNRYSLITNIPSFKNLKTDIPSDNCISSIDNENIDIYKSTTLNSNYFCIKNLLINHNKYIQNKLLYDLKYNSKGGATDIFAHFTLNQKLDYNDEGIKNVLYHLICDYVVFELTSLFSEYKYKLQKQFPNKIMDNDIKLIYKGGNTTRLYIRIMLEQLKSKNKNTQYSYLTDFYNTMKYGDLDFHLFIDYDNLKKQISSNSLDEIYKQCQQIVSLGLYKIKCTLNDLFNTELSKKYIEYLKDAFNNDKFKNEVIGKFINEYNEHTDKNMIKSFNLHEIKSYNYKYTFDNDKITTDYNNSKLYDDSFIVTNGKLFNNNMSIKNIDKISSFFANNDLTEFIPEYLTPNNLRIIFIDKLKLIRFKYVACLSLYRLKFENILTYKITLDDNIHKIDSFKIPIEYVDVSIINNEDTSNGSSKIFINNDRKYIDIDYKSYGNIAKISLPSPEYMFFDIAKMLFIEPIFAWGNPKYEKRMSRLFLLSIITCLNENITISNIIAHFNKLKQLLLEFSNKTIDDKYILLMNKINTNKIMIDMIQLDNTDGNILQLTQEYTNFYLDKIISNYFDSIIFLKYLNLKNGEKINDNHMNYCRKSFKIVNEFRTTDGTEIMDFENLNKFKSGIADHNGNIIKYENSIINKIDDMINILNEIGTNQNTFKIDYSQINCLS